MRVIWLRGTNRINFRRPFSWFITGVRGSGKSSFLEALGEQYLLREHTVLDLFGSRDGEGLAWCRSPWAKERRILLIHGANVDVDCHFDTTPVDELKMSHDDDYDIVISSSPLYSSVSSEFLEVNKVTDLIYRRMSWNRLIYCIVREAANLYYSRLKVDPNQNQAKAAMIYLIREARHVGMAMGLDTLKMTSIDLDVRAVTDFLVFKSQGVLGLPKELYFIYRLLEPSKLTNMPLGKFVVLHRGGSLGVGEFPEVTWHKQEKEHILSSRHQGGIRGGTGLWHRQGSLLDSIRPRTHPVSDRLRTGTQHGRNRNHTRKITLHGKQQIKEHNDRMQKMGHCPRCKRAGGSYHDIMVARGRAIQT